VYYVNIGGIMRIEKKIEMIRRNIMINYNCGDFATIEYLFRDSSEANLTTAFYIQDDRMKWDFWYYGYKPCIKQFLKEMGIIKGCRKRPAL